jgi:ribosomal-protein-alanine N-acetyltransferase
VTDLPGADLPREVSTVRLRLELVTYAEARGMLAGDRSPNFHPAYPRTDDLDAASMVRDDGSSWGPRHIVRAFDGLVVGGIGFFGPPEPADDGVPEAEVGYGLVEDARGHGAATEAVQGLLARTDALGVRVRASVLPENKPSVRVLAKCGFTSLRGSDQDGNLVMVRPLSSRPADRDR